MRLLEAQEKAEGVKNALAPYCKRIEIAGSIRRKCMEIGDIEIVLIPDTSKLYQYKEAVNKYTKIKGDPLGKYTQRRHPSGCLIDIFICTPGTWACVYFIRTGSASYIYQIMCKQKEALIRFRDGRLWDCNTDGTHKNPIHNIKEEEDIFMELGMEWVEPKDRI